MALNIKLRRNKGVLELDAGETELPDLMELNAFLAALNDSFTAKPEKKVVSIRRIFNDITSEFISRINSETEFDGSLDLSIDLTRKSQDVLNLAFSLKVTENQTH